VFSSPCPTVPPTEPIDEREVEVSDWAGSVTIHLTRRDSPARPRFPCLSLPQNGTEYILCHIFKGCFKPTIPFLPFSIQSLSSQEPVQDPYFIAIYNLQIMSSIAALSTAVASNSQAAEEHFNNWPNDKGVSLNALHLS
jgi:hypothetical protein